MIFYFLRQENNCMSSRVVQWLNDRYIVSHAIHCEFKSQMEQHCVRCKNDCLFAVWVFIVSISSIL